MTNEKMAQHLLRGTTENCKKILNQDSQCPDQNLNQKHTHYTCVWVYTVLNVQRLLKAGITQKLQQMPWMTAVINRACKDSRASVLVECGHMLGQTWNKLNQSCPWFSMVPKLHVALHASHAALPMVTLQISPYSNVTFIFAFDFGLDHPVHGGYGSVCPTPRRKKVSVKQRN
jgi:hypothetical protein